MDHGFDGVVLRRVRLLEGLSMKRLRQFWYHLVDLWIWAVKKV